MTDPTASAVTVKLPTFWPAQLTIWFVQAEAQFTLHGISSNSTKYYHVLAALDQDTAVRISEVILNVPANDKFDSLKKRLLQTFELQETDHAEQLLILVSTGLGDRTPSQLMEEILQLLGTKPFCFLCKQIFLCQLPTVVRTQLAEANFGSDPRAVANQATTLWCTARLDNQLVGKTSGITSPNNELCTITKPKHTIYCVDYTQKLVPIPSKVRQGCQKVPKAMQFSGKHHSQPPVSLNLVASNSVLLYASDIRSSCHFLIDTGTEISIFSAFSTDCIDTTYTVQLLCHQAHTWV